VFDWRNGVRAALALASLAAAACSEKLEEGGACGTLCPTPQIVITDTVLTPVDTGVTVPGYPGSGQEGRLLLAVRPTDLDVRSVIRFDTLPTRFALKSTDTTTAPITHADSSLLHVRLDLASSVVRGPVTIELFDVDNGGVSDTAVRSALPFFVDSRRIGSRTFQRTDLRDTTLTLPISDSALVAKASTGKRLRIGLRATSAFETVLRFVSTETGAGAGTAPFLTFRPSLDTASRGLTVSVSDRDTVSALSTAFDRRDYTILASGETPVSASANDVEVGGLPGRRAYLRFALPASFYDTTVTIVRAQLELTQLPTSSTPDTVAVFPVLSFAGRAVTDPRRAAGLIDLGALSATNGLFPVDSLRLAVADSGARSSNVLRIVRYWTALSERQNPHVLVLRTRYEGTDPGTIRFATGAPAVPLAARPRLVISYVKRVPFNLP
jgi:hypothetical protein